MSEKALVLIIIMFISTIDINHVNVYEYIIKLTFSTSC